MKILTSEQMKNIDRRTIQDFAIPGVVLMENAGIKAVQFLIESIKDIHSREILILCGSGNNGGDGFVVARHLFNLGLLPHVVLIGDSKKIKGDALTNFRILMKMGIEVQEIKTEKAWEKFKAGLPCFNLIIDALLGTGLEGPPRGLHRKVIADINGAEADVVAIDIPSGLSGSTCKVEGEAVRADCTVTFCCPKIPHIFPPAEHYVGQLEVADISIPEEAIRKEKVWLNLIEEDFVKSLIPTRKRDSHKGDFGHILAVCGSRGKSGAAALLAKSALKTGAGLVTIATAATAQKILAPQSSEMMTEPLPETESGSLSKKALQTLKELCKGKDLLAIGPGLTTNLETSSIVRTILKETKTPALVDADGINAFEGFSNDLFGKHRDLIITPHPGEMGRIIGQPSRFVQGNRIEVCRNFAITHHCYVVLKGYKTLISDPGGNIFVNPTGNPGLGTAGAGDVLTGMIAGFLVQSIGILNALILAVYLHGMAADLAAADLGEIPLMAGDVIDYIPDALMELSHEK
ncbi:MAG: NAD(P)H-hydrate dehydratase [Acidobacteriota bacterium]